MTLTWFCDKVRTRLSSWSYLLSYVLSSLLVACLGKAQANHSLAAGRRPGRYFLPSPCSSPLEIRVCDEVGRPWPRVVAHTPDLEGV